MDAMNELRIALLDMNNNHTNQGMRNIREISERFREESEGNVTVQLFDVRYKNEIPEIADFDVFISSGGPGSPHREGHAWESKYSSFLDSLWNHNRNSVQKKFAFLICHSFQIACIHWKLGNICKRKSYSFGVMPVHKSADGLHDFLFENLPERFYAVDSRAYQFIEPDQDRMNELGMKIIALEKVRPHIHLERAVMAVRFSDEIFGTQFHPEADPQGMIENLKIEANREAMIAAYGREKYLETVDRIDDPDKIVLTQSQILPRFLRRAAEKVRGYAEATGHL